MTKKQAKNRGKDAPYTRQRRIVRSFLIATFSLLCVGLVTVFSTHVFANTSSPSVVAQKQGGFWNLPDAAFHGVRSARTDSRMFTMGNSVIMPNGLEIQVLQVQYNWQPPAAMQATATQPDGDNPAGRQVVAIWFKVTDVGTTPIEDYNSLDFTLKIAGKSEQRVAHLSGLLPASYGNMGQLPWLNPGQSMNTFEPFLVAPGDKLISFQYYMVSVNRISGSTHLPDLTRLSFSLPAPSSNSKALTTQSVASGGMFTFNATQTVTLQ